jgi:ADP-ribose pyrophosphatase YjhB (NUDIX family)
VRSWQDRFTVSAAAFVLNTEGKVLLLNHVFRPFSGWGLPGGFLDHGESAEEAIRRELSEEAGIGLEDLKMYRVRVVNRHVEILFTARAVGEAVVSSGEIVGLGWFSADDLPKDLSKGQVRLIRSVLGADV